MKITSDQMPFLSQYGSEKHLDELAKKVPNFSEVATQHLVRNPFAQKRHLENVKLTPYNWSDKHELSKHPNLPDKFRNEFLHGVNSSIVKETLNRPDTTKEHLKAILTHPNPRVDAVEYAVRHPLADSEILHLGLDHPQEYTRKTIVREGNQIDRSHIDRALKDPRPGVRLEGLSHHLSTFEDHKQAAFHDPLGMVKNYAVLHPDFPIEDLKKIYHKDDNPSLKQTIKNRLAQYGEKP